MAEYSIRLLETPEDMSAAEELQRIVWPGSETDVVPTHVLITAVHNAGLVSLTHTPSPMSFLNELLDRPDNERPFLLLVVGYPAQDARVPEITKKPLAEIATFR